MVPNYLSRKPYFSKNFLKKLGILQFQYIAGDNVSEVPVINMRPNGNDSCLQSMPLVGAPLIDIKNFVDGCLSETKVYHSLAPHVARKWNERRFINIHIRFFDSRYQISAVPA